MNECTPLKVSYVTNSYLDNLRTMWQEVLNPKDHYFMYQPQNSWISNDNMMTNRDQIRIPRKLIVYYLEILYWYSSGQTDENHG